MRIRSAQDLGAVVRERRRELGLSQAALAERADVTRQWIIRFERGAPDVSFAKTITVLRVLELDLRAGPVRVPDASRPSAAGFKIPTITAPRLDLSGIDWRAVEKRLAAATATNETERSTGA